MKTTKHRLTWRGYFPVVIEAASKEDAIKKAIEIRLPYLDEQCAELHYGLASGCSADAVYVAGKHQTPPANQIIKSVEPMSPS